MTSVKAQKPEGLRQKESKEKKETLL